MVVATRSTEIGVFASQAEAEQAVCSLLGAAFGPDQIAIVLPDAVAPAVGSKERGPTKLWAGAMFRLLIGSEMPTDEVHYYEQALQADSPGNVRLF
jgi:hypothetical protein